MEMPCSENDSLREFNDATAADGYVSEFTGIAIPHMGFTGGGLLGWNLQPIVEWGRTGTYRLVYVRNDARQVLLERRLINSTEVPYPADIAAVDPCGEYIVCQVWQTRVRRYLWVFARR